MPLTPVLILQPRNTHEVKAPITTAGAMGYWVMLILVDIMDGNAGNIISS